MERKMSLMSMLLIDLICLSMMAQSISIKLVKASVVDDAISLAESFLDRAYHELNSTHAVCKEYPSIPFRVYDETHNYWLPLSKEYADVDSLARFKGGCKIEHIKLGHAFVSGDNNERWYRWDCDANGDYDDLVLWCEDSSADNTHIWMHVVVEGDPSATFDLYLGDSKIIDNCGDDDGYSCQKERGWFSQRYSLRHATRLMQWYYEDRGNTARATKLDNTMDGVGFNIEFYAPLWNKSQNYADNWYSWTKNKTMYRDYQIFDKFPWNDQAIPYHSNLAEYLPLDGWQTMLNWFGNPLQECVKSIHLLNKYPNDQNKISTIESDMNDIIWDGYGIKKYKSLFLGTWKEFGAYNSYATSVYGYLCGRLYELTGKTQWRDKCREACGVILNTQLKDGLKIYADAHGYVYRADSIGGFLISYVYDNTFYFKGQAEGFAASAGLNIFSGLGYAVRDKDEYQCAILTNTETTLICWKFLKYFDTLSLSPIAKSTIDDWNGHTATTWSVDTCGCQHQVSKAFCNGYVEMRVGGGGSHWATATLCYEFQPVNTTIDLDVAFSYVMGWTILDTIVGYGRLRFFSWIKDIDDGYNEVWSYNYTAVDINYGNWWTFDDPFYGMWNKTLTPAHTFNTARTYQWFLKFDMDCYQCTIDCANCKSYTPPLNQTTHIFLDMFIQRDHL